MNLKKKYSHDILLTRIGSFSNFNAKIIANANFHYAECDMAKL